MALTPVLESDGFAMKVTTPGGGLFTAVNKGPHPVVCEYVVDDLGLLCYFVAQSHCGVQLSYTDLDLPRDGFWRYYSVPPPFIAKPPRLGLMRFRMVRNEPDDDRDEWGDDW
jgi:hypothetical protein